MLVYALIAVVGLYAIALLLGYLFQRRLIYIVDPVHVLPQDVGLAGVTEVCIDTPDGARVLCWHAPARPGQRTILYFHGNGGSLAARVPRIERFTSEGWGVFMMTYRGYGGSTGRPSEEANVADGLRAFDWLTAHGVAPGMIVIYGESLGTGVAARVALGRPEAAGLVLDAPFTSIVDVAAKRFRAAPVRWILSERYETVRIIQRIKVPLLILHGALDETVPVEMGRRLAGMANAPKTFVEFPRGGHSDLYLKDNNALGAMRSFVGSLPLA